MGTCAHLHANFTFLPFASGCMYLFAALYPPGRTPGRLSCPPTHQGHHLVPTYFVCTVCTLHLYNATCVHTAPPVPYMLKRWHWLFNVPVVLRPCALPLLRLVVVQILALLVLVSGCAPLYMCPLNPSCVCLP